MAPAQEGDGGAGEDGVQLRQPPSAGNFPTGQSRTAKSNEAEECG